MTNELEDATVSRLSVNINEDTANAIREIKASEGISATETIRRAVSFYRYLLDCRDVGDRILRESDGSYRELVIL